MSKPTPKNQSGKLRRHEYDLIVSSRIRAMRLQSRMSQEVLGEKLGLTFQQIQKYEKGSNRVTAGVIVEICKILGCNIADIFQGIETRPNMRITERERFFETKEYVKLVDAMSKIDDVIMRRKIVEVAEALVD